MKHLKKLSDFQKENHFEISNLEMATINGGRDQYCNEEWDTTGGDCDKWVYWDTDKGKKFVSHELEPAP